jgi:hypothetical protein
MAIRNVRDSQGRFVAGIHYSPETEFKKGMIPWISGKMHSEETRKILSKTHKGKVSHLKGKLLTQEHKEKLKGIKRSLETRKKISEFQKGRLKSKETRRKMRESHLKLCKDSEYIKKILRRRIPSSLEKKMIEIIDNLKLPYIFVGNGRFWIENINPDFINCNGEKIAIEVFYRKHKEQFAGGLENWKNKRGETANKYGWKIIFLNETQVNKEEVLRRGL